MMLGSLLTSLAFTSCRDDEFSESIFPISGKAVDDTQVTYEFDQWIYDNFTQPYNTTIDYKMYTPATNLDFQLCAPDYERSVVLAQLIRHLFFDLYTKEAGVRQPPVLYCLCGARLRLRKR